MQVQRSLPADPCRGVGMEHVFHRWSPRKFHRPGHRVFVGFGWSTDCCPRNHRHRDQTTATAHGAGHQIPLTNHMRMELVSRPPNRLWLVAVPSAGHQHQVGVPHECGQLWKGINNLPSFFDALSITTVCHLA